MDVSCASRSGGGQERGVGVALWLCNAQESQAPIGLRWLPHYVAALLYGAVFKYIFVSLECPCLNAPCNSCKKRRK